MVSVGRDRSGLFQPAVDEYAKRLSHYTKLELIELSESRHRADPERAKREEGELLLGRRARAEWLVALDERGKQLSSRELADYLGRAQSQGASLLFALGGDEGLSEEVRAAAQLVLSLSRLTLPHRLARVVLCEQLYRACTLLKGEPYHK